MLIRVSGGNGGITEYLINGIKNGRDFTRDELDERLVLDGDLDVVDSLIQNMDTKGEKYLHITLSFKEDHLSPDTLRNIALEFKQFSMQAYGTDEYCFYAEAHLPKIKTYQDKETGELIERKPHIHVVIPKINTDTGKRLDPFELVKQQERYIDAFQEIINEKYQLASPKIHTRDNYTNESTILSRNKGDVFKGNNLALKEQILTRAMELQINSQPELASMLQQEGYQVIVRNEGKPNAYLNIRKDGYKKGTNLKEAVFKTPFLSQSTEQQNQAIAAIAHPYVADKAEQYRAPSKDYAALRHWQDKRAFEVRHVNARNRTSYKSMPPNEQQRFLKDKASLHSPCFKFEPINRSEETNYHLNVASNQLQQAELNYQHIGQGVKAFKDKQSLAAVCAQLTKPIQQNEQEPTELNHHKPLEEHHDRQETNRYQRTIDDNLRAAGEDLHHAERNCHHLEPGARRITDRLAIRTIRTVVQRYNGNQNALEPIIERQPTSSLTGQRCSDNIEKDNAERIDTQYSAKIRELNATDLLLSLSQSHGVIPDKYAVTKTVTGDRIVAGSQAHSIQSFLTKEMHFSCQETSQIINAEYARQQGISRQSVTQKDREQFDLDWRPSFNQSKRDAWNEQKNGERNTRKINYQQFKETKNAIYADTSIDKAERKAALSIARMNKVVVDIQFARQTREERQLLHNEYPKNVLDQYQLFDKDKLTTESPIMQKIINGKLKDHGFAPYKNIKGNSNSYFVTLTKNGKDFTIWSLDLERGVSENQFERGENVKFEFQGNKPVEVTVHDKDDEGKIINTRTISAHRNVWEASPDIIKDTPSNINKEEPQQSNVPQPTITAEIINKGLEASRVMMVYPELRELGLVSDNIYKMPQGDEIHMDGQRYKLTEFIVEKTDLSEKEVVDKLSTQFNQQIRDNERVNQYKATHKETDPTTPIDIKIRGHNSHANTESQFNKHDKIQPTPVDFENITYKTDEQGNVNYYLNKALIVKDSGNEVQITKNEEKAIEIGIRLSMEKFGNHLDVRGTPKYKNMVAEIAAIRGLNVQFNDSAMNDRYNQVMGQLNKGKDIEQQHIEKNIIKATEKEQPSPSKSVDKEQAHEQSTEVERDQ